MIFDLKLIGARCKAFRADMGCTQSTVALETGYSIENVSSFECGRNDNARILLWYMTKGLKVADLLKEGEVNG